MMRPLPRAISPAASSPSMFPFRLLTALLGGSLGSTLPSPALAQSLEPPPTLAPAQAQAPPPGPAPMMPGQPAPVVRPLPSMPIMPPPARPSAEESEDSGLGLEWVWINADVGASYANMQSFSESRLALVKTESGGPTFGIGAGVRLLFLTLGVRVRDLVLSSIGNLWELSLEAKLHTRIWHIDPYFGVRGGYNFVGSLNSDTVQVAAGSQPSDVNVHGFNVGPVIGIDGYITKLVSIGVDIDAQFLFLQRPPLALPAGVTVANLPPDQQQLYGNSGSSVGFSVTPTAHLGIHF